jgi:RNA polymerase sigma-70 factor (ECF subfamily)
MTDRSASRGVTFGVDVAKDLKEAQAEASERDLRARMVEYQAGSLDAFTAIYTDLAPSLRRYLRYLSGRSDLAEDLLQESFLELHRSRAAYNPAYPVTPWVFGLARNVFRMNRRAAGRFARIHEMTDDPGDLPVPPGLDRLVAADQVRRALVALGRDKVEPLLLHHVWGFSFKEIAGMLGMSAAAARARSSRGMTELRVALIAMEEPR